MPNLVVLGKMVQTLFRRSGWKSNPSPPAFQGRSLKIIWTDSDRSATFDFLLKFHSNNGPISYHFRDGDFSRKSQILPTSGVFDAPNEGVLLGIGYTGAWGQKLELCGYLAEKEVWRYIQPSRYNIAYERDRWTDGRTPDDSNYCALYAQRRAVKIGLNRLKWVKVNSCSPAQWPLQTCSRT